MRNFILLILFFGFWVAHAQPTITSSNMPSAGNILRFRTASTQGISTGASGANQVWDFTQLNFNGEDADTFVSVSSTPFAYQLFFNNPLSPNYAATVAARGSNISIPGGVVPISITQVFNYFKKATDRYDQVGFGATISGIPTSIKYDEIDHIYRFPMALGNEDSCTFRYQVTLPTLGWLKTVGQRKNNVDAWGTLNLPFGATYPVLRVRSEINQIDSVHIDQFNFTFGTPRNTIEYKWLSPGFGEPVLQINTTINAFNGNETVSSVRLKYTADPNAGLSPLWAENVSLYPNPGVETLNVSGLPVELGTTLVVYSVLGQELLRIPATGGKAWADVSSLPNGSYLVQCQSPSGNTTRSWVKSR
jgi:hypothetical protein